MLTFIHTADWHLGMTRRFLAPDVQARYGEARIEAVREIGRMAEREGCAFVLVCGDVFDSNQVDRQVVVRTLDALASYPVPVLILPGNHDPLDAASVYRSRVFRERRPATVWVIEDSDPIAIPGSAAEVVGAPWCTRHPGVDLAVRACADLVPDAGLVRVLAAHGAVDALAPDVSDPAVIRLAGLRDPLASGAIAYVALGDRHSVTSLDPGGLIRYPGTPVATGFFEEAPNQVLLVSIDDGVVRAQPRQVGDWHFVRHEASLTSMSDVDTLDAWLAGVPDKARTVVRLSLRGALTLAEDARLDEVRRHHSDLLASLTVSAGRSDIGVIPGDGDLQGLGLMGYAADAAAELVERAGGTGDDAHVAQEALRTLFRLTRGAA